MSRVTGTYSVEALVTDKTCASGTWHNIGLYVLNPDLPILTQMAFKHVAGSIGLRDVTPGDIVPAQIYVGDITVSLQKVGKKLAHDPYALAVFRAQNRMTVTPK